MLVAPVKVLAPERVKVPEPTLVSDAVPFIFPEIELVDESVKADALCKHVPDLFWHELITPEPIESAAPYKLNEAAVIFKLLA